MSKPVVVVKFVVMVTLVVVAASGCAGSSDETSELTATTIDEALGVDITSGEDQFTLMQDQVAECMKQEGFEYRSWNIDSVGLSVGSAMLQDDPAVAAEENGFGIANRVERGSLELTLGSDPNTEIMSGMSAAELESWSLALEGDLSGGGQGDGCVQRAQDAVFGVFSRLEILSDELTDLEDRIATDPRVVRFQVDWQDCVASRGFGYESPNAMIDAVMERLAIDGLEIGSLDPPTRADLADIREFESSLAVADVECTLEFGDVYTVVRAELESDFVEEHAGDLERIKNG